MRVNSFLHEVLPYLGRRMWKRLRTGRVPCTHSPIGAAPTSELINPFYAKAKGSVFVGIVIFCQDFKMCAILVACFCGAGGLKRIESKYTWGLYASRLLSLSRMYSFWKYVSKLERRESRRYLEMFYSLKMRPLIAKVQDCLSSHPRRVSAVSTLEDITSDEA